MIDNSGIQFFYTSTRRQHDAGILTLGHAVNRFMIVPPNAESYSILGECSSQCTSAVKLQFYTPYTYRIVPSKRPWALAAQPPKSEGGRLHGEGA